MISKTLASRLTCPECGAPSGEGTEVITCEKCGTKASAGEWAATREEKGIVEQPPATNIRRESTPGGTAWHIPATGKFGFFMFFGVFWCAMTALLSGGLLFTVMTGGNIEGDGPRWLLIPIFGVFWSIGLGMVYMGVREKWLHYRLSVDGESLVLRREMFGRHREQRMEVTDIRGVEQKEFYQKNYQPVHGIEIQGARGRLRFGSGLSPEEKAWLVAELREVIFGPAQPGNKVPQKHFSIEIPNARKHLWPLAIMLMVIGSGFIFIGLKFLNHPTSGHDTSFATASKLFDLLSQGFQGVWVFFASLMAIGGLGLGIHLFRQRNQVKKLEGNDYEIALRTYRDGRVWEEKTFARKAIDDIRAYTSGSSNGKTMKRLELIIGDKVELLARWIDGEVADAIAAEVRAGL